MTKFILVLWMCSMATGQCPSSSVSGYQFNNHSDCVNFGYGVAQKTFKGLEELEEYDKYFIEESRLIVRFECRPITITIPKPKPKTPA